VQPLPFALMRDDYPMINGRGYPDTLNPDPLPAPVGNGGIQSQPVSSLVEVNSGDRVLLRISNISVTRFFTLASSSLPLTVVARDAKLLRGPSGADLSYATSSVTLGGGETADVIFEAPVYTGPTGTFATYFLYTTNLNYLNNSDEENGGMMTEIHVYPVGDLAPQAVAGPANGRGTQLALEIE